MTGTISRSTGIPSFYCASELHGDMIQKDRDRVLDRFRGGEVRVLVATDVAGRGLDVLDRK